MSSVSLSLEEVSKIDQNCQYLVSGYIGNAQQIFPENNVFYIIPKMIDYLCLFYYYEQDPEIQVYNVQSEYNDSYYCDVLSYTLSYDLITISFHVHGDMSYGELQDPSESTLRIEYGHWIYLTYDDISYEIKDWEYEHKGKISYKLSKTRMDALKNNQTFAMYFEYGEDGYDSVKFADYNSHSNIHIPICINSQY